mgnify:CR=1 FL=1
MLLTWRINLKRYKKKAHVKAPFGRPVNGGSNGAYLVTGQNQRLLQRYSYHYYLRV